MTHFDILQEDYYGRENKRLQDRVDTLELSEQERDYDYAALNIRFKALQDEYDELGENYDFLQEDNRSLAERYVDPYTQLKKEYDFLREAYSFKKTENQKKYSTVTDLVAALRKERDQLRSDYEWALVNYDWLATTLEGKSRRITALCEVIVQNGGTVPAGVSKHTLNIEKE